jgi:hypothetical protein
MVIAFFLASVLHDIELKLLNLSNFLPIKVIWMLNPTILSIFFLVEV